MKTVFKCREADIRADLTKFLLRDFDPSTITRRSDFGTSAGAPHVHPSIFFTSSRSLVPSHKITCVAPTLADAAHLRNALKSPRDPANRKSTGAISSPTSSYRPTTTFR